MQGTRMAAAPVDAGRRTPHLAPACASGAAAVLPVEANGRYTADEFMALPLDLKRYELVRGVLAEVAVTGYEHAEVEANIFRLLDQHVWPRRLGRITGGGVMFRLQEEPDTLRRPDVAFVRTDRLPARDQRRSYAQFIPELAVEILSPSNTAAEMRAKVAEYLRVGVRLVWVVDPERETVTVHTPEAAPVMLPAGAEITGGVVLPDFRCPVAAFFDLA